MGDCRKSGRLCTKKLLYHFTLFLKKSRKFLYKMLKKAIDFTQQIPYILSIRGEEVAQRARAPSAPARPARPRARAPARMCY